jgi:hypothetical protein
MYSFLHTKPISWSGLTTYPRWRCPVRWSTCLRMLGHVHTSSRRGVARTWWLGVCMVQGKAVMRSRSSRARVYNLLSTWLFSHKAEPRRPACIFHGAGLHWLDYLAPQPGGCAGVCVPLWAERLMALYRRSSMACWPRTYWFVVIALLFNQSLSIPDDDASHEINRMKYRPRTPVS